MKVAVIGAGPAGMTAGYELVVGGKNKPVPTRSTPLHARLQAVENLTCAAEYLLGVGAGGSGGGGEGSNEEGHGIADAYGVGEGDGHAVHGEWRG